MIYVYNDIMDFEEKSFHEWEKNLDRKRVEMGKRYRMKKDKCLCLLSHQILLYALKIEYGVSVLPKIATGKLGKPYFENRICCFNISHCDTGIVVAVSDKEIGVDIQNSVSFIKEVKNQFLCKREEAFVMKKKESPDEILKIWTLKEAYGKCRGVGLLYPFKEKDFSDILDYKGICEFEKFYVTTIINNEYILSVFAHNKKDIKFCSVKYSQLCDTLNLKMPYDLNEMERICSD